MQKPHMLCPGIYNIQGPQLPYGRQSLKLGSLYEFGKNTGKMHKPEGGGSYDRFFIFHYNLAIRVIISVFSSK